MGQKIAARGRGGGGHGGGYNNKFVSKIGVTRAPGNVSGTTSSLDLSFQMLGLWLQILVALVSSLESLLEALPLSHRGYDPTCFHHQP